MRKPRSSSPPFPVSTSEWMPSESMAELPVKKAATNLVAAMARLPAIAAKIAVLDSLPMEVRTWTECLCAGKNIHEITRRVTKRRCHLPPTIESGGKRCTKEINQRLRLLEPSGDAVGKFLANHKFVVVQLHESQ